MSVISKAEVTISDILDGNSISDITNFYKVSSKPSGETAPQTSGGRNLARRTSSEWSEWWTPIACYNSCATSSYIFPGDIKIGDAFTTTIEIEVSKFAFTEEDAGLWSQGSVDGAWNIGNPFAGGLVRFTADELSKSFIKRFTKTSYVNNDNYANAKQFDFGFRCDYSDGTGKIRWRLLKAEKGNVATDWTPAPEDLGWSTTVPTLTDTNKYLWNYEMITGSDGQVISYTEPRVIGVYGDKGQTGSTGATGPTGNGIKSITEYYQISTSNTTTPTTWLTTVPTLTATNKYLWNYEKITYTNGTSVDTAKRVIGVYGDKGNTGATGPAGKGIKSTAITYQASTSGTTAPTGTWNTSVPSVPQGQYLWSRTVITYTDNSTSTTYSVAYIPENGQNGATGATGTGVASIVQQYYLSTSKTSQTGGSWVTSMPTWSSGKYLWTRYQINYKNPTSTAYTSPICDSSWEASNEAAKTATNYMNFDSNGLVIGDLTKETLGQNVRIDTDSVNIRKGDTTLATFTAASDPINSGSDDVMSIELHGSSYTKQHIYSRYSNYNSPTIEGQYVGLQLYNSNDPDDPSGKETSIDLAIHTLNCDSDVDRYVTSKATIIADTIRLGGVKIEGGDIYDAYNMIITNGLSVYGGGNGPDPNTTLDSLILSAHANAPGSGFKYIYTAFYDNKTTTSNRGQFAIPYGDSSNYVYYRSYYNGSWSAWKRLIDANENSKLLLDTVAYMHGEQTLYLSEPISAQKNGVVFVWSLYLNGQPNDSRFSEFFLPKRITADFNERGHHFTTLSTFGDFGHMAKYVYIYDTYIRGHNNNISTITNDGVTFRNTNYVLRKVYGV